MPPTPVLALVFAAASAASPTGEAFLFSCQAGQPPRAVACRICLIPEQSGAAPTCADPGEPLLAAPGRHALRALAAGFSLSSNERISVRARSRRTRPRPITLTLTPGGLVETVGAAGRVEVFSLETGRRETLQPPEEPSAPLPAGTALAILQGTGATAGVTRPVPVPGAPGAPPAPLRFESPSGSSGHVVARLDYADLPEAPARDVRVRLVSPHGTLESGAASNAVEGGHLSAFYDVPAGAWGLEVRSEVWWAPLVSVDVRQGAVARIEGGRLLPRPNLTVELDIRGSLAAEPRAVALHRCAPGEWSTAGRLDPERCPPVAGTEAGARTVFARIAPAWHVLETRVGAGRSRAAVDMRSGADLLERVVVEPTRLSGTVRRGRQTVGADLLFERVEDPQTPVSVRSGSDGLYRAALWPQGAWRVRVEAAGTAPEDAPLYALDVTRTGALTRNFELPMTEAVLSVVDERSREGIPGAEAAFLSFGAARWRTADESGLVRISQVAPGRLEVTVEADGYRRKTATFEVEESASLQPLEIRLASLERENAFRALLASGEPAVGARVVAVPSGPGIERDQAVCDADGVCFLAERPPDQEILVVAHPEAGVTAVTAREAFASRRVRLSAPGGFLRLLPRRGEKTEESLLQVFVTVGGATLPPAWLDNVAVAIARPSRTSLFPGSRSGFFLSGLPSGPVSVTVAASAREETGGFGPPEAVAGPFSIELPAEEISEIELP